MKKNALAYLNDKYEREHQIKLKELELEERKISIEEQRLKLEEKRAEIEERKVEFYHQESMHKIQLSEKRSEKELEEKKITNQLLKSQQMLIENLLKKMEH